MDTPFRNLREHTLFFNAYGGVVDLVGDIYYRQTSISKVQEICGIAVRHILQNPGLFEKFKNMKALRVSDKGRKQVEEIFAQVIKEI